MELQEKTSQLIMRDIRNYEISVWTLQDDFITVLKHSNLENKGQIQNGEMTLNVDGTQELSFSIPLYYNVDGVLVENPLWNLYKDGALAVNLKKLKVIMNKGTPDVEIYEFMILKVTERHEKNELYCDVECEGLAFQELGKQGYKISLSSDDFFAEDLEWFQKGTWKDYNGNSHNSQPVATLQYWCDKFLQPYPGISTSLNPKIWYYQVQMDWSSFSQVNSVNRDSSKVYEEEFIGNWTVNNDTLEPGEIVNAKEKARLVDFEESNIYNLTQDLAETFGVYCKYIFDHDDQYHITGRRIVFYNNFIEEQVGAQDITYKYNTTSISRTLDSTDLVTKMYVRPVDDDLSPSGLITIMDVDANKSKEDYLLNFDYLHDIGAIDDILYNEIPTYEAQMREINTQIVPLSERLIALQDRLPKAEAKLTTATNAIQLDKERISAASSLLNNLTGGTGRIEVTENNPDTAILMQSKSGSDSFASYYIKISKQGVIPDTLHIYRNLNFGYVAEGGSGEGRLTEEITTGQLEYDEFGNLAKVINLYKGNSNSRVVYLTYAYSPKLYYERVINTWTRRLALDTANQAIYSAEVMTLTSGINILQEQYNTLLATKAQKIKDFELLMGPALREGYWQPDDYIDYGDNYVDSFSTNVANPNTVSTGNSGYTSFIWDLEPFEDEQLIYTKITAGMSNWYYPTIDLYNSLTNATIRNKIVNNLDNLSFLYYDNQGAYNSHDLRQRKSLSLGSGCQLGFVKSDVNGIHPILILNGAINELDKNSEFQCYGPALGILTPSYTSGDTQITVEEEIFTSSLTVAMMPYTKVVYPRIQINSLNVKTSEDQLSIKINNHLIKNYEDFYILYKQTSDTNSISKLKNTYITLKPETLIKNGLFATNPFPCEVKFSLSNADTAIYLDAMQVLKDSSVPQVSYDLKVGLMQRDFIRNIHRMLNRIVHINDYELRFDHVRGYVSEVVLDLDHPWEDTIEVKNYTTKFEDLFAKIVASTEAMKKTQYLNGLISGAFTQDGYLSSNTVRSSLRRVDLNYAFNNGTLTIDEKNGIWGVSDAGVVAFRGGGIFTATEKDSSGNWIWNTGIVPQGINADLIVSGQLDTNRIRIYAGDRIRFQLNGDGLFAYKSFLEDFGIIEGSDAPAWAQLARSVDPQYIDNYGHYLLTDDPYAELDPAQYVVLEENGLFLKVEEGAYILNNNKNAYIQIGAAHEPDQGQAAAANSKYKGCYVQDTSKKKYRTTYTKINNNSLNGITFKSDDLLIDQTVTPNKYYIYHNNWEEISKADYSILSTEVLGYDTSTIFKYYQPTERVAITWNGLTLRNYFNEQTFFADADTGNLYLAGTVFADEFFIKSTREGSDDSMLFTDYLSNFLNIKFDDHVKVSESLAQIFDEAGEILDAAANSLTNLDNLTIENTTILGEFLKKAKDLQPTVYTGATKPTDFKPGDIWEPASGTYAGNKYLAMSFAGNSESSLNTKNTTPGWNKIYDGSLSSIVGAGMTVDAAAGTMDLYAGSKMTLRAKSQLDLASGDIQITGNNSINIGSKWVNIGSANGGINIISTNINNNTTTGNDGKVNTTGTVSKVQIDRSGIIMHSNKIELMAADSDSVAALKLDPATGVYIGSNKELRFFSSTMPTSGNSGASVLINPSKILFGVSSTGNATVVEMEKDFIILATGSQLTAVENATSSTWTAANASISGVKITKDGIWMATGSGTNRGLIALTPTNLTLGVATNDKTGSFIKLSKDEFILGSSSNMYINATNIALDTVGGNNDTVGFRLGPAANPVLKFVNGTLYLKDGLIIGGSSSDSTLNSYVQGEISSALNQNGAISTYIKGITDDLQSQLDGEIDTWFYVGAPTLQNVPASDWTDNTIKERHIGDVYYDIGVPGTEAGQSSTAGRAWRFTRVQVLGKSSYVWQEITDTATTAALAAAADAKSIADGKIKTFAQNTQPTAVSIGDLWINTGASNQLYRWTGSNWNVVSDTRLGALINQVGGKTTVFYSSTTPTSPSTGDIWYDTSQAGTTNGTVTIYRWGGSSWIDITENALKQALSAANDAQSTADGKIVTFAQANAPTSVSRVVGDLWIDTDDKNKLYRWSGTQWLKMSDSRIEDLINEVDGKTTIFYSTTAPSNKATGDIWYDTTNHQIKRWTGTQWANITSEALKEALDKAGDAKAIADGKIKTFAQTTAPTTGMSEGDLWIDLDDNNKLYRYNSTTQQWVDMRDGTIAAAQSKANDAYTFATNINNGTTGLLFKNSNNVVIAKLTQADGLKIIGQNNTYLQANNEAMGFFDSSGNYMLAYRDGNMWLRGGIAASTGYFGATLDTGWQIKTIKNGSTNLGTMLYNVYGKYGSNSSMQLLDPIHVGVFGKNNSSSGYKYYSGIYLWADARANYQGGEICIYSGKSEENTPLFRVSSGWPTWSDAVHIGNDDNYIKYTPDGVLKLSVSSIEGLDIPSPIYTATSVYSLDTSAKNGSLGVIYSDGSETASSLTPPTIRYENTAYSNGNPPTSSTRFSLSSIKYWQIVTSGSINSGLQNNTAVTDYFRVGCRDSNKYATGAVFYTQGTVSLTAGASYTISLNYVDRFTSVTWDAPSHSDSTRVNPEIYMNLYYSDSSSNEPEAGTLIGTPITIPLDKKSGSTSTKSTSVTFSCPTSISNKYLFIVFYSNKTQSVCYIRKNSVALSGVSSTTPNTYGLYVRSQNTWNAVSSGSGGSSTPATVPTASIDTLGVIKIGRNLQINNGVVTVKLSEGMTNYTTNNGQTTLGIGVKYDHKSLTLNSDNRLSVNCGNGLEISNNKLQVKLASNSGLTFNDDDELYVTSGGGSTYSAGNGININSNTISVRANISTGLLVSSSGVGINYGDGLTVSNNQLVPKIDDTTIKINSSGQLYASSSIPTVMSTLNLVDTDSSAVFINYENAESTGKIAFMNNQLSIVTNADKDGTLQTTQLFLYSNPSFGLWRKIALSTGTKNERSIHYILHTGMKVNSVPSGAVQVTCYYNSSTGQFAFV